VKQRNRWKWAVNFFMLQALYSQGKNTSTHSIGDLEGPRANLDVCDKRKISCPC